MTNKDITGGQQWRDIEAALDMLYERATMRLEQIETQINALGQATPAAIGEIRSYIHASRQALTALNGDCGGGDLAEVLKQISRALRPVDGAHEIRLYGEIHASQGFIDVVEQALTALNGGKICAGKDELCPCQDGDMCHYKGENPFPIPSPVVDVESLKEPPTAIRLTDYSKGYGDGWNKCIDELAARGLIGHYLPKGDE